MTKQRMWAVIIILLSALGGYLLYATQKNPASTHNFKLGLDLSGGTHLVYQADTSSTTPADVGASMSALRDDIENRVNPTGVNEAVVQASNTGALGGNQNELLIDLPGVTTPAQVTAAENLIGQNTELDFLLVNAKVAATIPANSTTTPANLFEETGLTGSMVTSAAIIFDPTTGAPEISLNFNSAGATLFDQITKNNINQTLAIFLDGTEISAPVIQQEIANGQAQITGTFTTAQAQTLVQDLNLGALPIPIHLIGAEQIGASLGQNALHAGVMAGIIAYIIIALFLILWYRLPGLIAAVALAIYVIINLLLYKFLPGSFQITLTAAGIAGFILSVGMAVDANILIFERMKEELRRGKNLHDAMHEGFTRAWASIRDSNLSSIITALILYFFASTDVIKGFALVFLVGVLTSMFTAITVTRTLLFAVGLKSEGKIGRFMFHHRLADQKAITPNNPKK